MSEPTYQELWQHIIRSGTELMQLRTLLGEVLATLSLERNRQLFDGHPHAAKLWGIVDDYKARYEKLRQKGKVEL